MPASIQQWLCHCAQERPGSASYAGSQTKQRQCALASLQLPQHAASLLIAGVGAGRRVTKPEMLKRVCTSWNKGRCVFLGLCRFRHAFITCKHKGHHARNCEETPADSLYKTTPRRTKQAQKAQKAHSAEWWQQAGDWNTMCSIVSCNHLQ